MRRRHIDDKLLNTPALRMRLDAEARFEEGGGTYRGFALRSGGVLDGHILRLTSLGNPPPLDEMQVMFGQDMVRVLNRHLHHDGAWVVLFTHPSHVHKAGPIDLPVVGGLPTMYGRFAFLWMDRDGDVQFTMDSVSDFFEVLSEGPDPWIERAEQAWQNWKHVMRDVLAPKEGETYKRALGEAAPSAGRVH